jgi:hypothetical protein
MRATLLLAHASDLFGDQAAKEDRRHMRPKQGIMFGRSDGAHMYFARVGAERRGKGVTSGFSAGGCPF